MKPTLAQSSGINQVRGDLIEEETMGKKSDRFLAQGQKERGAILVLAALFLVVMLILVVPFLFKLSAQYRVSEKSFESLAAVNLAEAGVDRTIWELNHGDISTWDGDDSLRTMTISSDEVGIGDIDIRVENPAGDFPVVESIGRVAHTESQTMGKTIRVVLEKNGGGNDLFNSGVFADRMVHLNSNIFIDGDVGINGTEPGAIFIKNNTIVNGDVTCGPGGDPGVVIDLSSGAVVTGEQNAAPEIKELPSVMVPEGLPLQGSLYQNGGIQTISESGQYASIILEDGSQLVINAEVVLYVTDEFSLGSSTELRIEEGGSLTLYLSGPFHTSSNCFINNVLQDPTKLVVYGTDEVTGEIVLDSNATVYGALYMPRADLVLSSNITFHGAVLGRSVYLNANVDVLYDEELGDLEGTPGDLGNAYYSVKSWQESRSQ